ncbi:MAG: D-2-hydroxyacid dehydrogenase [Gammaproteobacteria bacterium]|nr:D-2-hydroxyacid dehydrogenase [Gammaproteobacteria bacterium]
MSQDELVVLVQGASDAGSLPGIERVTDCVDLRFAGDNRSMRAAIAEADILFGWDFRDNVLREVWSQATRLKWVQWSGAGVDAVLFPEFAASDVVLTNARGVFDRAMAEYALGLILAMAKSFPDTWRDQTRRTWKYRLTERVLGRQVLVIGVGSIGREVARMLSAAGLQVSGVGRSHRARDPDFDAVYGNEELPVALPLADYVVVVVPSTEQTRGMLGADEFRVMKPSARLINLARGDIVDEAALCAALSSGTIAGAALDVFATEPLPESSPLWDMHNVIVSPHISGDFIDHHRELVDVFVANLQRYIAGQPLRNVVDKALGFVEN